MWTTQQNHESWHWILDWTSWNSNTSNWPDVNLKPLYNIKKTRIKMFWKLRLKLCMRKKQIHLIDNFPLRHTHTIKNIRLNFNTFFLCLSLSFSVFILSTSFTPTFTLSLTHAPYFYLPWKHTCAVQSRAADLSIKQWWENRAKKMEASWLSLDRQTINWSINTASFIALFPIALSPFSFFLLPCCVENAAQMHKHSTQYSTHSTTQYTDTVNFTGMHPGPSPGIGELVRRLWCHLLEGA